ncbi:MAG: PAS domain S-box protein [Bacteroidales bacterium]|nr:PAS domain S-box protein [Bacteroidales bacterium]
MTTVLLISIIFQIIAVFIAFRLIKITKSYKTWIFIALAILLMAIRRMLTFINVIFETKFEIGFILPEYIALTTSILVVAGLLLIIPLFKSFKEKEIINDRNEAELKSILLAAPVGIGVAINRKLINVNERFCKMLGYSENELLGKDSLIVYPSIADYEYVGKEKYRQISEKGTGRVETKLKKKDGVIINVIISSTPLNVNDLTAGIVFTAQDITDRKKSEDELNQSHQLMNYIIAHNPNSIAVLDEKLNYIYVSQRFIADYKTSKEKIIGKNYYEIFPETPKKWKEIHQKSLKGGVSRADNDSFLREDGLIDWIKWECRPWYKSDKSIGGIIIYTEVITERIEAEKEIKKLSLAVQQSSVIVIITDIEGNIEFVNDKFTKVTGYQINEVIGKNPRILKSGNTSKEDYKKLWDTITSGNAWRGEFSNKKKNEELYYESASIFPLLDENGNIINYVAIKEDVTEQKETDNELNKYRNKLEILIKERTKEIEAKSKKIKESQTAMRYLLEDINETQIKLEKANIDLVEANNDLKSFSYSVSHDLKAPLRAIEGFAKEINNSYKNNLNKDTLEYFNLIIQNVDKMNIIIDKLLILSRLGRKELQFTQIDMNKLIAEQWENIKQSSNNVKSELFISNLENCFGDKDLVNQVIFNLLSNAVKFSKNKENPKIEITCKKGKSKNTFCVKDNGVGFDMKYYDKLFAIFQRLHKQNDFEGTGIGLSIVKKIIIKHNGKIWAESEPNKGAAFYFSLPAK